MCGLDHTELAGQQALLDLVAAAHRSVPGTCVGAVCGTVVPPATLAWAWRNSGVGPAAVCSPLMTVQTAVAPRGALDDVGDRCWISCAAHFGMVSRMAQSIALCGIGRFGPVAIAAPWVSASRGR